MWPELAQIDWTRPWFDPVRPAHAALPEGPLLDGLNACAAARGLANHAGLPLRFVPQAQLPEGTAYEAFIGATGCVPTRQNLHDFFNALVWLTFPRVKRELNALQAAQIALDGIGKSRGPARDAATIFDENAALLVVAEDAAGQALVEALRTHDWQEALLHRRGQWGTAAQLWTFGHALMEKLVAPRKAITAHTRVLWADSSFFGQCAEERRTWIDGVLAEQLVRHPLDTSCFTPLPVLGVPGWWTPQDEAFYADAGVFRPKRKPT
ncbi:MAG: DUF3025 domain-containing protein [Telluria sp.]